MSTKPTDSGTQILVGSPEHTAQLINGEKTRLAAIRSAWFKRWSPWILVTAAAGGALYYFKK